MSRQERVQKRGAAHVLGAGVDRVELGSLPLTEGFQQLEDRNLHRVVLKKRLVENSLPRGQHHLSVVAHSLG